MVVSFLSLRRLSCLVISLCWLTQSCEFRRMDTTKIKSEMQKQEIKHVTAAQLTTLATDWGEQISKVLHTNEIKALNTPAFTDSLAKQYGARIQFVAASQFAAPAYDEKTKEVLAAYAYNAEKGLTQEDNIQKLGDGTEWLYTVPLLWKPTFAKTAGLKENDLYGVWTIQFSRKELVQRADPRQLEKPHE
ncbi:MAG: hypothetical protein QM669_01690 [Siphonobacter sp.]